jgi:3-deoxy-D-manno-octulosonic-acid transferase
MTLLYNFGIAIYYSLILLASLFNKKAKLWISGRRNTFSYLKTNVDRSADLAWFHVSSLGEFEQGKPIFEAFRLQYPDFKILLTFFSPSGYEIRKEYDGADYICYIPLDTYRNAKRFMKFTKPKFVFFVKYDYWYHLLKQAKNTGAKLFLISGVFREDQAFFKWYGGWYRQILKWFNYFFVQNQESAEMLNCLGLVNHTVAGDTRFDRVVQIAQKGKSIKIAEEFSQNSNTVVCGSTWPADEEHLSKFINNSQNVKLILAPHETNKAHIEGIIKLLKVPYSLYSKANTTDLNQARVLIVDNIGMLSSLYKYGQIAYIGGGFGVSIHNTLEAAVYGVPVIFGPNYHKFQEARDLISCHGAVSFSNYTELKNILDNYLTKPEKLSDAGKASGQYVMSKTGATSIILNFLKLN